MEVVVVLFLGGWLAAAGILAYLQLRKDFGDITEGKDERK